MCRHFFIKKVGAQKLCQSAFGIKRCRLRVTQTQKVYTGKRKSRRLLYSVAKVTR